MEGTGPSREHSPMHETPGFLRSPANSLLGEPQAQGKGCVVWDVTASLPQGQAPVGVGRTPHLPAYRTGQWGLSLEASCQALCSVTKHWASPEGVVGHNPILAASRGRTMTPPRACLWRVLPAWVHPMASSASVPTPGSCGTHGLWLPQPQSGLLVAQPTMLFLFCFSQAG